MIAMLLKLVHLEFMIMLQHRRLIQFSFLVVSTRLPNIESLSSKLVSGMIAEHSWRNDIDMEQFQMELKL